jgi:hypothetical protein
MGFSRHEVERFAASQPGGGLTEHEIALLADGDNWRVTQGDSDIDCPGAT